jgi:CheY-like chemotaxis protein
MGVIAKVLLVDDEPDIRRIGELSLRRVGGWDVAMAGSGLEAIELFGSYKPDIVLLDVMMPTMDGPQTLAKLREIPEGLRVPVIFVTAKVQRDDVTRLRALGAIGVVSKPFDPMTLPAEIRRIVSEIP